MKNTKQQKRAHVKNTALGYINAADAKDASVNTFVWTSSQNEEISDATNELFDLDALLSSLAIALDTKSDATWSRSRAVQALADIANDAASALVEEWSPKTGVWSDEAHLTMGLHIKKLIGALDLLGAVTGALDGERMSATSRDPSRVTALACEVMNSILSKLETLHELYREHVRQFTDVHDPHAVEICVQRDLSADDAVH